MKLPKPIEEALNILFVEDSFQYRVLKLHLKGLNAQEITDQLKVPYSQVHWRLHAAKKFVQTYVRETFHETFDFEDE